MRRDSVRRRWGYSALFVVATAYLAFSDSGPLASVLASVAILGGVWGSLRATRALTADRSASATAHLSHELRTPLTSVLGIMDLLEHGDVDLDPTERDELIGLAHREALQMGHIVSNLMASSRVQRGSLRPVLSSIDPAHMVARALERMPSVEKRAFVSRSGSPPVHADPALVLQILLNLLQNVERYAPEGEVEIECAQHDAEVVIAISDDGPGISGSDAFEGSKSTVGLGVGLALSRTLAQRMGGDLRIGPPRRSGATLELVLPMSDAEASDDEVDSGHKPRRDHVALSPRARLLVDMTEAVSNRSLDRVVVGLEKLCIDLLGAHSARLAAPDQSGGYRRAGSYAENPTGDLGTVPLDRAMSEGATVTVEDLVGAGESAWAAELDSTGALFVPVRDDQESVGVLVVGWKSAGDLPGDQGRAVASAVARLASIAIDRTALVAHAAFERGLRSSVMESLPIAISVFAGDPPQVIDWNQRERAMLGITDDSTRPSDLMESQQTFDVRFADGTPLDVENAPVTQAIRTGRSTGPFLLLIRRVDGTETTTRTYCAPFFDNDGAVIGAVVTSEELDVAVSSRPDHPGMRHSA